MQKFIWHSDQMVVWHYDGKKKPWMYTVAIQWSQNFAVLIWLELKILYYTGIDHYGFLKSDKDHNVVFSTYLWRLPVDFYFLSNTNLKDNPLQVICNQDTQTYKPSAIYKPHWRQRLGIYG
jgi:lipopolysaccharide biosynthesis glycosyltransferase